MSKSCICYVRTGTENPNQFQEQVTALESFAVKNGYEISQIFDDYGVSGAKLFGREGLDEAMNHINEHPEISALIVDDLDRLTRSLQSYMVIREFLQERKVQLLFVKRPNFDGTADGSLADLIMASINEFQSQVISKKVRASQKRMVENGLAPFALPLGYKRNGQLIETDSEAAKAVTQIFKLYESGNFTARALSEHLKELNLLRPNGKPFTASSVLSLLKNRFYIGRIAYSGQLYKGNQPAIIDKGLFYRCQQLLQSRFLKQGQRIPAKAL